MRNDHSQAVQRHSTSQAFVCVQCSRFAVDDPHREPLMPCHKDRPGMAIEHRAWLRTPQHRSIIARLWHRLESSPRTIFGTFGNLDGTALEDDGLPECIVSHWRDVRYMADGARVELIPGGYVARDLQLLGLSREAVVSGTVVAPATRCRQCRPQTAVARTPAVRRTVPANITMEVPNAD